MGRYLVRKILSLIFIVILVSLITFTALQVLPGDPALLILGTESSPEALAAIRSQLGLDKPALVRFGQWLVSFVQGDLGQSIRYSVPVRVLVARALPITLTLALWAVFVSLGIAILLGVVSAAFASRWWGRGVRVFSQLGMAVPQFWIGILFIQVFAVQLRVLPAGGFSGPRSLILPVATLALPRTAVLLNMVQSGLANVLGSDYIRTAKAKGLPWAKVLFKHALINGAIATATSAGIQLIQLLAGTIVVEQVFGLPGMGQLVLTGVLQRDLPLVQAVVVLVAIGIVAVNFTVDLALMLLDPRIRFE
ncbi:MAG: ABC transporter permease [Firmicutes bacterium]|nr:ABC transporter permease [Bacillota bacterium]